MFSSNPSYFLGIIFLAASAEVIAMPSFNFGSLDTQNKMWTETYLPYNGMNRDAFGKPGPYTADDPLRQHLNLFQHPSNQPTPVYFFAHSAGGSVASLDGKRLKTIASAGYSVISWESVSHMHSLEDFDTAVADFELLWSWFQDNAAVYNFDPESVVIGGSSRGSIVSWLMAHSQKPEIKGIYMNNALPDGRIWSPTAMRGSSTIWEEAISTNSPPTYLVYEPECPKPIQQNCVPSPNPSDIHNPKNGQIIVDRYTELGIESKIRLIDGLDNKGINMFDFFPEFVASLSTNNTNDNTTNNQAIPSNNTSTNVRRGYGLRQSVVILALRMLVVLVLILLLLCWLHPKSTSTAKSLEESGEQKSNENISEAGV